MIVFRTLAAGLVALAAVVAAHGQTADRARLFPRELLINDARIVIHAPQVESWKDHETIVSWHALEVTFLAEGVPHVGAVKIRAATRVDKPNRTVQVDQVEVLEMHFLGIPEAQAELLSGAAKTGIQAERGVFPLDLVLSNLARQEEDAGSAPFAANPPVIHTADSPTVLVLLDGDPAFAPIEGTDLRYVVNTNWDLVVHSSSGTHYLLHHGHWLEAAQLQGPWKNAATLPKDFSSLPPGSRWDAARAAPASAAGAPAAPKVLVSTRPAELILTEGTPLFRESPDTLLAYVDNTDSDVFMELTTATYYFLVAGRWFKAPAMEGPWESAGPLPEDFGKIPPDGPRGSVLVSVPGTWEARLAVLEARIPLKAKVDTSQATLQVAYHGDARFEPIPGTSLSRAVNTKDQVLQVQENYFACRQGVWFLSSSPKGPWIVAPEVPEAIYTIPTSSPAYPVTFVRAYEHKAGKVTFGYTAGYENVYVSGGVVVYGTGRDLPPYLVPDASPPVYYPGFSPFGAAAYYDPHDGLFQAGAGTQGVYAAWGSMVATPEHQWEGRSQRLASPVPGSVTASAQSDLYVGPDRHVYRHGDDGWNRVSSGDGGPVAEGGPADREQEIQDEQAQIEAGLQEPFVRQEGGPADREQEIQDEQAQIEAGLQGQDAAVEADQWAQDQALQDQQLPQGGVVLYDDLRARSYYDVRRLGSGRRRRAGTVRRP